MPLNPQIEIIRTGIKTAIKINQQVIYHHKLIMSSVKNKGILALLALFLASCSSNNLADTNVEMPALNWLYANKITAVVNVKEINKPYNVYFKLRHSANYRYANLYILLHFTAPSKKTTTTRYQFKLAKTDGQWRSRVCKRAMPAPGPDGRTLRLGK